MGTVVVLVVVSGTVFIFSLLLDAVPGFVLLRVDLLGEGAGDFSAVLVDGTTELFMFAATTLVVLTGAAPTLVETHGVDEAVVAIRDDKLFVTVADGGAIGVVVSGTTGGLTVALFAAVASAFAFALLPRAIKRLRAALLVDAPVDEEGTVEVTVDELTVTVFTVGVRVSFGTTGTVSTTGDAGKETVPGLLLVLDDGTTEGIIVSIVVDSTTTIGTDESVQEVVLFVSITPDSVPVTLTTAGEFVFVSEKSNSLQLVITCVSIAESLTLLLLSVLPILVRERVDSILNRGFAVTVGIFAILDVLR